MKKYTGKPVCKGIRSGAVFVIKESREPVKRKKNENPEEELSRLKNACVESVNQFQKLHCRAIRERNYFIQETGLISPVWQSAVVMTACGL